MSLSRVLVLVALVTLALHPPAVSAATVSGRVTVPAGMTVDPGELELELVALHVTSRGRNPKVRQVARLSVPVDSDFRFRVTHDDPKHELLSYCLYLRGAGLRGRTSRPLPMARHATLEGLEFGERAGTVRVRLVDAERGEPISGWEVSGRVWGERDADGVSCFGYGARAQAGVDGVATLEEVLPGEVMLSPHSPVDWQYDRSEHRRVAVEPGADVAVELQVRRVFTAWLELRRDPALSSYEASRLEVNVMGEAGVLEEQPHYERSRGKWRVVVPRPGTYQVQVSDPAGAEVRSPDFEIPSDRGAQLLPVQIPASTPEPIARRERKPIPSRTDRWVGGRVLTPEGTPAVGIEVRPFAPHLADRAVRTAEDGSFRIENLLEGDIPLVAEDADRGWELPGLYIARLDRGDHVLRLRLHEVRRSHAPSAPSPTGVLFGSLRDAGGRVLLPRLVQYGAASGRWHPTGPRAPLASREPSFLFAGLTPGRYRLRAFADGFAPVVSGWLDVVGGERTGPVALVAETGGSISGRLTRLDHTGASLPVPGVAVRVHRLEEMGALRCGSMKRNQSPVCEPVETDEDGRFSLEHLPEGAVEFTASAGREWCAPEGGFHANVRRGSEVAAAWQFTSSRQFTGRLVTISGEPVPGLPVSVRGFRAKAGKLMTLASSARAGAEGAFAVRLCERGEGLVEVVGYRSGVYLRGARVLDLSHAHDAPLVLVLEPGAEEPNPWRH